MSASWPSCITRFASATASGPFFAIVSPAASAAASSASGRRSTRFTRPMRCADLGVDRLARQHQLLRPGDADAAQQPARAAEARAAGRDSPRAGRSAPCATRRSSRRRARARSRRRARSRSPRRSSAPASASSAPSAAWPSRLKASRLGGDQAAHLGDVGARREGAARAGHDDGAHARVAARAPRCARERLEQGAARARSATSGRFSVSSATAPRRSSRTSSDTAASSARESITSRAAPVVSCARAAPRARREGAMASRRVSHAVAAAVLGVARRVRRRARPGPGPPRRACDRFTGFASSSLGAARGARSARCSRVRPARARAPRRGTSGRGRAWLGFASARAVLAAVRAAPPRGRGRAAHQRHHHQPRRSAGLRVRPRDPDDAGRDMATRRASPTQQRAGYPGSRADRARGAARRGPRARPARRRVARLAGHGASAERSGARRARGARHLEAVPLRRRHRVRVRPAEDGGSVVDMRSKSRVGQGDLGVNAARIRAFTERRRAERLAAEPRGRPSPAAQR